MIRFDQVLVNPPPGTLTSSIDTAVGIANFSQEIPRLDWRYDAVETLLARIQEEPEGEHSQRNPQNNRCVRVTWWSDVLRNRHVRVTATEREELSAGGSLLGVYPDAGFVRKGDDMATGLLVVCPCGAVGRPDEIAWMGRECGPCHDRRVAGDLPARLWDVPTREFRDRRNASLLQPQFCPGADRLLIDDGGAQYEWDIATGQQKLPQGSGEIVLGYSPDGTFVVVAQRSRRNIAILRSDTRQLERTFSATIDNSWDVRFSPSGRYLLVAEGDDNSESSLRIWDLHSDHPESILEVSGMMSWTLSPDEETLYLAEYADDVRVFPLGAGDPRRLNAPNPDAEDEEDEEKVATLAGGLHLTPDGRSLIVNGDGQFRVHDVETGRVIRERHLPAFARPGYPGALLAGGRVLLVTDYQGRTLNFVTLPDLTHAVTLTALDAPNGSCVAWNDHWLAVGDFERVRITPLAPLLDWYLREIAR
jgi:hypothetical protein